MQRFRGGLVLKAHKLWVSLNSRLESNKEEEEEETLLHRCRSRPTGFGFTQEEGHSRSLKAQASLCSNTSLSLRFSICFSIFSIYIYLTKASPYSLYIYASPSLLCFVGSPFFTPALQVTAYRFRERLLARVAGHTLTSVIHAGMSVRHTCTSVSHAFTSVRHTFMSVRHTCR